MRGMTVMRVIGGRQHRAYDVNGYYIWRASAKLN